MFKIQILNPIAPLGLAQFPSETYEVGTEVKQPDAILVRSANLLDHTIPASVKVVGRAGVGLNNIPVAALTKKGIPVLNTPGANANAVSELVIAGLLLASRHICEAWHYVTQLKSSGIALLQDIENHKKQFTGVELQGRTLGVIGLGSVGVRVANAAVNLGMHVIGYDPTITVSKAWQLSSQVEQARDVTDLLKQADFISLHVPLTETTKHMMSASHFAVIKAGAVLLNFARDEIIDNDALLVALNDNKMASYVTDFPVDLLKNHPRVISLPHLGASTKEAEENCAVMIVRQVRDFLERGAIVHSINFPSVDAPYYHGGTRLAIVNANVPNMVAQISTVLAKAGLNIISLSNNSKEDIAYTLIDVNQLVDERVEREIAQIQGVIHCRKLLPI